MSEDYYTTLIKDIIENNDKEEAIKIIANKLNKKQKSNEKEILANIEKAIEIERLNNIIKEVREYITDNWEMELKDSIKDFLDHDERIERKRLLHILDILDKGE